MDIAISDPVLCYFTGRYAVYIAEVRCVFSPVKGYPLLSLDMEVTQPYKRYYQSRGVTRGELFTPFLYIRIALACTPRSLP
jgi:hypothetical protein